MCCARSKMASLLRSCFSFYDYCFHELGNPHIKDWFLMSSPFPTLAIMGIYLWFVKDYGPKLMQNRPAYDLKRTMQIYNLIQVFLSGYTCYKLLAHGWLTRYSWRCEPTVFSLDDPEDYIVATMVHLYYVTKIIDLLDTIFFTLRKKWNQISFLHVYHHCGMVALSWSAVKWFTTGHGSMIMMLNSGVHTLLYLYYFLTSVSSEYNSAWWKKYLTTIQLVQFMYICIHFGQTVLHNPCHFGWVGQVVVIPQNVFIFTLFADFYYKTYIAKKKST
ncbi:elongation of very long chain fatty acids protein 7-like isoform X1 [Frankliniella occidentalis]|uniref:Elongation of very long chain fatty acids protein n=2 Tax=Frankliniella occidentalis TaxID=133901 RepID=A0A9C6X4M8_FRAOC|nr:elongation of very long chain fatty acids protein 7-like isoform X1 [Frankliniella occidentalis]